jgi:hypothetical protein
MQDSEGLDRGNKNDGTTWNYQDTDLELTFMIKMILI